MENEGLTARQVFFMLTLFLTGNLVVNHGAKTLPTGWLAFLALAAAAAPLLLLYAAAAENCTAWEIFPAAFGKAAGGVMTALYCAFALLLAGDAVRTFSDFIVINDLNNAGPVGNSTILLAVSVLLLLCSMETIGKAAWLTQPLIALLMLVSLGLTLSGARLERALPLFAEGGERLLEGTAVSLARTLLPAVFPVFTVGGTVRGPWKKSAWRAGLVICLFLAVMSLRDTLVLGYPLMSVFRFPDYMAANTFHHSEVLVSTAFVLSQPFRVALCLRYVQECLVHWRPQGRFWYPAALAAAAGGLSCMDLQALPRSWRLPASGAAAAVLILPPLLALLLRRAKRRRALRQSASIRD